ncbi:MAG: OsmC family protein, partial [Bacteroidota bacterium]
MNKTHQYPVTIEWTGNTGQGTSSYRTYKRDHTVSVLGKQPILCSSDPSFRGDPKRYNPEEQFVAAISSCHMLWYLHLCASAKIVVLEYRDEAVGTMEEHQDGSGQFTAVVLKPKVKIENKEQVEKARV